MGSSMVNSSALLLGIFTCLGIWLNGKTYAAPNQIDCESSSDGCPESYTVKPKSKISQEIRDVLAEMKKIERMENELLKEIKKKKADKAKNKPKLLNSFLKRLTGQKHNKTSEFEDYDKAKLSNSKEITKDEEDEEEMIYAALWDIDKNAPGCLNHYTGGNGTIHFSSVEVTGNWRSCFWTIDTNGSALEITFHNFSMNSCERLIIGDGTSLLPIAIFQGNSLPGSVRLPDAKAYILFVTRCHIKTAEFTLHWNSSESGCTGLFNNDYGMMHHPVRSYSNNLETDYSNHTYSNNESCTWIINSSRPLQIRFSRFSTEECCDFLYIRDGNTSKSDLLAILRGNSGISSINTSNSVHLHFTSDYSNAGQGFTMLWKVFEEQQGCGGIYSTEFGTIRHPATGDSYRNNQNCTWIINSTITLDIYFESFNTESCCDHLYVRDGTSSTSPLIGQFSGNIMPTTLRTSTNAYIQFISDANTVRTGFVLHWNVSVCGAVYNVDMGIIRHPETGEYYKNNEDCRWIIRASKPINITFDRFDTESGFDYLYIRDGENTGSPVLRFTGNDVPSLVQTRTNAVHLSFTSDGSIARTGFALQWNSTGCGGHYTNDTGEITFPQNGGSYDNNQHCVWIIETAGPFIEISSSNFDTEANYDILILRDGNSSASPLMGNFSGSLGNRIPLALRTATSKAYLSFISDSSIVGTGFVISWNAVDAEGNPDCNCGSLNSYQEIVGGEEVEYKVKYPWHVGIFSRRHRNHYFCGGTLISDKYVITAAHCMFPRYSDLMVQIGDHIKNNITDDIEGITEAISVENVYIHPGYIKRIKQYDFALLRLSKSIKLTDGFGIRPICLPHTSHNTSYSNYTGQLGLSVGWGTLSHGSMLTPDSLHQVEMTILSPECRGWSRITPAMLCSMERGKDTCQGDSGGSLAVVENGYSNMTDLSDGSYSDTNEYYVLVGVISWGRGCAARTPGVYSRITAALDWIQRFAVTCNRRGAE